MQLTTEQLTKFIGGDMEIQNRNENYLYRGLIESVVVEGEDIKVRFKWLAKNDGGPNSPTDTWTTDEKNLDYVANLLIYSVFLIPTEQMICLYSQIIGETVVLFPKDGKHLDPARVKGLAT